MLFYLYMTRLYLSCSQKKLNTRIIMTFFNIFWLHWACRIIKIHSIFFCCKFISNSLQFQNENPKNSSLCSLGVRIIWTWTNKVEMIVHHWFNDTHRYTYWVVSIMEFIDSSSNKTITVRTWDARFGGMEKLV